MKVFAHRGFSGKYPENTILAFEKALELNIYGIELDVQKTKDDKIVVIHDETIDRTHDGKGYVKDYTLEELRKFNCKKEEFKNNEKCKIPTLEEVIKLILPTNLILNIELKNNIIEYENLEIDVIELIKKYNLENRIILSSFSTKSQKICKTLTKEIEIASLSENTTVDNTDVEMLDYVLKEGFKALHIDKNAIDEKLIERSHKENIPIRVYTVNSKNDIKKLLNLKVDGIFTDFPNKIKDMI